MSDHHHQLWAQGGALSRREALLAPVLGAFCAYALVGEARAAGTVQDGRLSAKRWIGRQEALARGLRSGAVSAKAWHDEVNRLAREVDVAELLAELKAARSTPAGAPFMRDPVKRRIRFVDETGQPRTLSYAAATFTFGPDNVITPHAHKHMASAHMVIDGQVRIRTFDRVADLPGSLVIRPTGDVVGHVGEAAAMTTAADNVHWFTPRTRSATTFDVIVDELDGEPYLIQPLDPLGGRRRADGTIEAPIVSFEAAMRRYRADL